MNFVVNQSGYPGDMFSINSTDTAQEITLSNLKDSNNNPAISLLMYVENNDIRITFDGSEPSTTDGFVVSSDSYFSIENWKSLQNLKFISASAGSHAKIIFQPYFNRGV